MAVLRSLDQRGQFGEGKLLFWVAGVPNSLCEMDIRLVLPTSCEAKLVVSQVPFMYLAIEFV